MSTKPSHPIRLSLSSERKFLNPAGGSVRHIIASIEVDKAPLFEQERPAQNLALVIDRSGSMSGDRFNNAKKAALEIIERLDAQDRLAIVVFDNEADTVVNSTPMDAAGRHESIARLNPVNVRGSTNLFAGFQLGAEHVATQMESGFEGVNRVILLSDGHANHGLLDITQIARHVRALSDRGIVTSTVGIGDHYESRFLQTLAEAGGGEMHDAELPEEIVDVVLGELGEASLQFTSSASLTVKLADARRIKLLSAARSLNGEHSVSGSAITVPVGALRFGQKRNLVFRVTFNEGTEGSEIVSSGKLGARDTHHSDLLVEAVGPRFVFVPLARVMEESNAAEPALIAALAARDTLQHEAAQLNREGLFRETRELVRRERYFVSKLVRNLPQAGQILHDLDTIFHRSDYAWEERARKEMELSAYKNSKMSMDFRSNPKAHWKDRL